jgi:type II secretory pathway pseudopilin PulG
MSLRQPHHNICRLPISHRTVAERHIPPLSRSSEAGYTLVALLALMTLLALFATAAAPSIRQQAQREREKESIFRGEQVADAVRDYYLYRVNSGRGPGEQSLPTSMEDLLEGVPVTGGTRKRQILRASAARDPLSTSGEWGLVRPRSPNLLDFQRSVVAYAGNLLPQPANAQIQQLQQFAAPMLPGPALPGSEPPKPGEGDSSAESSGPFVGVSSRSKNNSVLYYYGIDRHDRWIFTPLFR